MSPASKSTLPKSMFEDPVLQELVETTRNRYGRAGLVVLAELCRRELTQPSRPQPGLVGP